MYTYIHTLVRIYTLVYSILETFDTHWCVVCVCVCMGGVGGNTVTVPAELAKFAQDASQAAGYFFFLGKKACTCMYTTKKS